MFIFMDVKEFLTPLEYLVWLLSQQAVSIPALPSPEVFGCSCKSYLSYSYLLEEVEMGYASLMLSSFSFPIHLLQLPAEDFPLPSCKNSGLSSRSPEPSHAARLPPCWPHEPSSQAVMCWLCELSSGWLSLGSTSLSLTQPHKLPPHWRSTAASCELGVDKGFSISNVWPGFCTPMWAVVSATYKSGWQQLVVCKNIWWNVADGCSAGFEIDSCCLGAMSVCIKSSLVYFSWHTEKDYSKDCSALLNTSNSLTQYQFKDALAVLNFNLASGKEGVTEITHCSSSKVSSDSLKRNWNFLCARKSIFNLLLKFLKGDLLQYLLCTSITLDWKSNTCYIDSTWLIKW